MQARIRNPILIPVLLASSACNSLNPYACIYQTRFVATSGSASAAAGGTIIVESLNLREDTPEAQTPVIMTWTIRVQDLIASPVRMSLRDARTPTEVVKWLPYSGGAEIAASERDRMFNLLTGNAVLVVELFNGSSVSVPLKVTQFQDWHRPSCD